jgi:hypothetical protein
VPDDLEWPRRVIVGAIVVIGVARLATFAEGPGAVQPRFNCGDKERPPEGGLAVQCAGPK